MKNEFNLNYNHAVQYKDSMNPLYDTPGKIIPLHGGGIKSLTTGNKLPEILFLTSYPPRECGIATYSQDLVKSLEEKFENSFSIKICALESENEKHKYSDPEKVKNVLDTSNPESYKELANSINTNPRIGVVLIQHEFGFFHNHEPDFFNLLNEINKPIAIVFHTVLPRPDEHFKAKVQRIAAAAESVVVMTNTSSKILESDYNVSANKIVVIPHGTHLVPHLDKDSLKEKYRLSGKRVLSTFGLLSSGKNIETTLESLPAITKTNPDVVFLIIGKTHPSIVKNEGEKYRDMLKERVRVLNLDSHVRFINKYLPLPELLEYLQLTDIYLFTSKDPNQAVSGTFSYAISCGCPIISTPIPHAREILRDDAGIFIDFENPQQLSQAVNRLLYDENLKRNISLNGLHRIVSTAWENAAISHAKLFEKVSDSTIGLKYSLPEINLNHIKRLTTNFGMIQFSNINQPDPGSGYTLDDNARALIAMCQHYELTGDRSDIKFINIYFNFVKHCFRPERYFLNYVDEKGEFTEQNNTTNLADANGRAIWALGYVTSLSNILPKELIASAEAILKEVISHINSIYSTRAMAFVIKGLYYYNTYNKSNENISLIVALSNRLVQMYRHESDKGWEWFESYLTYANGTLPEAMLCAYLATDDLVYKNIAKESFDFLLANTFSSNQIKVISNKGWLHKGEKGAHYGEQPIDVSYTILALDKFYSIFKDTDYLEKMHVAFNWFLGNNHLGQIIYNPCTGGCYDGLEETHINLNQGAESTVSYLMARLIFEKHSKAHSSRKRNISLSQ